MQTIAQAFRELKTCSTYYAYSVVKHDLRIYREKSPAQKFYFSWLLNALSVHENMLVLLVTKVRRYSYSVMKA